MSREKSNKILLWGKICVTMELSRKNLGCLGKYCYLHPVIAGLTRNLLWRQVRLRVKPAMTVGNDIFENFVTSLMTFEVVLMKISVYGHAFFNFFTFTEDGLFKESFYPNGAMLLGIGLCRSPLIDAPAEEHHIVFRKLAEKFRRECAGLRPHKNSFGQDCYYISRHLGYKNGTSEDNIIHYHPLDDNMASLITHEFPDEMIVKKTSGALGCVLQSQDLPSLVVWDEGYDNLDVPMDYQSVLWASGKVLPDKKQFGKIDHKCMLVLDVNVLRRAGAMISRQISWERTVADVIRQIQNNEALTYLMSARNIMIVFAEDGILHIDNTGGKVTAHLTLGHGGGEGALRENAPGDYHQNLSMFTLILANLLKGDFFNTPETWVVRASMTTTEAVVMMGYQFDEDDNLQICSSHKGNPHWPAFLVPLTHIEATGKAEINENWTIANNMGDRQHLYNVAFDYVSKGAEAIEGLPQLKFGGFTTVDRWEIEAYQDIRNLIKEYTAGDDLRPLSVAVFGAPGSGKSFGVTQIAQNVLPGKIEKLEFNVSQFASPSDLANAFQKVRDVILRGKLPLVFFDEFDSDRDGAQLGWLKSFLMPMQDGMFRDESGEHPLGRCILVFAGGTAATFDRFIHNDRNFEAVKGPDFVSRLRGTIDVLGPNPKDEDWGGSDDNYLLRRALLLRSLCSRKLDMTKQPAPINTGIIRAMLLVPKFKHGARSMEAVFNMSRLEGGAWEPAALPSQAQLALHLDANAFIKLVLEGGEKDVL